MADAELLLEVRLEEVPARMLPGAARELATRVFEELVARGLAPGEVEAGFTPRRLWLILGKLPLKERDRSESLVGPPLQAAFAADGSKRPAFEGFLGKAGVAESELLLAEARKGALIRVVRRLAERPVDLAEEKGLYLAAERTVTGRPTSDVLADLLPTLLRSLSWAKTMRWGTSTGPWVRPVHGVVALLDGEVVDFELFGIRSGRETSGHPTLSPERFEVVAAADWKAKLAERGIVPLPEERKRILRAGMAERAAAVEGRLVDDDELLDKLAAICEIPGVLEGSLDEAFLELPREVLVASLRDHQSALTVEKGDGLAPVFLTVMDRPDDPAGRVRAGNEWVVAARLADARFFFEKDRERPLEASIGALEGLGFHQKLGSYAEKRRRLLALGAALSERLRASSDESAALERALSLLKVDLTTEMVREFTSLQGVVGGIYARADGLAESVWQAIYDQYLPAGAEDSLPRGLVGRLAALADRLDTLVGFFGLGLVPTGSRDPFGLRRAALGVVRIVLEGDLEIDLEAAAKDAHGGYAASLANDPDETWSRLAPFLEDRARYLLGLRGYAHDEIEAGLGATGGALRSLALLDSRVAALHGVRDRAGFLSVALSSKRLVNILKDVRGPLPEPDPKVLSSDAEAALLAASAELEGEIEAGLAAVDFARALAAVERFAEPLDRFFVEVLVMDPDETVRVHRLALLDRIRRSIASIADLSAVVVDKAELRARAGD
ncbi:MAG TPA: glycine--tRNA ligase subunit beta [Thermoanaerobaculia bacterium]|nr:glycine--tRNA ligase subunit beta [Thermoanaerobaculia bacterium]